jgi:uncharacterized protein YkwD
MAARDYFSHDSLSGASAFDRVKRTRYTRGRTGWLIGENIAWASGSEAAPRSIMGLWMDSPGHRANILRRDYREIGIGVAFGTPDREVASGATYTTDFGSRGRRARARR